MTEAVRAVVAWGFETLALARIVAYTDRENDRSRALLVRVGFVSVAGEAELLAYRLTRDAWASSRPPGHT